MYRTLKKSLKTSEKAVQWSFLPEGCRFDSLAVRKKGFTGQIHPSFGQRWVYTVDKLITGPHRGTNKHFLIRTISSCLEMVGSRATKRKLTRHRNREGLAPSGKLNSQPSCCDPPAIFTLPTCSNDQTMCAKHPSVALHCMYFTASACWYSP